MPSPSTQRVQQALRDFGIDGTIQEMPSSTRTAQEAADAVGATVAQIVKSLVFVKHDDAAVLVLAGGDTRVDTASLTHTVGGDLTLAHPDLVRTLTGFAIGGVAPIGLTTSLPIFMDEGLLKQSFVWAAAGSPHAVFGIEPNVLQSITGAQLVSLRNAAS